jgi:hypothetical protein
VARPGALDVLILESQCHPTVAAETLRAEILAQPGVASVDFFEGTNSAPTDLQLSPYDVVLAMGDCGWFDAAATGDSLVVTSLLTCSSAQAATGPSAAP